MDLSSAYRMITEVEPDEIYNLAAQSFIGVSFSQPIETANITGIGVLNLLEAIRTVNHNIKFFQASTSEMFGKVKITPQNENTPFYPRNPYGIAKLFAHWTSLNYRETYDIFASSGILFNHESPLRGKGFVTRKISDAVAKIHLGKEKYLELGNLNAKRDWGYAKEYVKGMYKMLQEDSPGTYVFSTNKSHSVRDFVTLAFKTIETDIIWYGEDKQEKGYDRKTGNLLVKVNPSFYRVSEENLLIGDSSKAEKELNWKANVNLEDLVQMMVLKDIERNNYRKTETLVSNY